MISENRLPLFKMRTYIEGGGQILPAASPETGAEYRAKNREIKKGDRLDECTRWTFREMYDEHSTYS